MGPPPPQARSAVYASIACRELRRPTEAIMRAHGFTVAQLVELVRAGLATATPQRIRAGHTVMEVATLRITEEGAFEKVVAGRSQTLRIVPLARWCYRLTRRGQHASK